MGPVERDIERYLVKQCRQRGFLCLKFVSPARNGVPDRIVVTPAKTVFVELKRPGGSLRKIQRVMHAKLRRHGASVNVVDEHRSVDRLIAELSGGDRSVPEPDGRAAV